MEEQVLFDRFHAAFDVEPSPGSFDRMRAAMASARRRPTRREWLRLRFGRNGVRVLAAVAALALILAGAGAFVAVNHYLHRPVPVEVPHGAATGTCTGGLHMRSDGTGWNGLFARTSDGGATWTQVNGPRVPNQTKGGGGECTIDGLRGWTLVAVGPSPVNPDRLVVMLTTDGGQSWKQAGFVPLTGGGINSQGMLEFINANDGWLLLDAGTTTRTRTVFTTSDGGYTWVKLASGSVLDQTAQGCAESGLTFVSGERGWITWDCSEGFSETPTGGGPVVAVTDDGGATWTAVTLPSQPQGTDYMCTASAPQFVKQAGVMPFSCGGMGHGGWSGVYRTADLGASWEASQAPFWFQRSNIQFVDATLGFAFVTPNGHGTDLYRTTDAGRRWTLVKKDAFAGQSVGLFYFLDTAMGFAQTSTSQGAFWKTTDGGLTWTLPGHRTLPGNVGCPAPSNPGAASPIPILMAGATTGWAAGARHTVDGGGHWTPAGPPSVDFRSSGYSEFFLDADHAWVAETAGSASACADHVVVFSTADGGRTWRQADPIAVPNTTDAAIWGQATSASPQGHTPGTESWLQFVDPEHGWLFVETRPADMMGGPPPREGPLYRTTDGGLHWSVVSADPEATQQCRGSGFSFSSPTDGWMPLGPCSGDPSLSYMVTHDGGASWAVQPIGINCGCQGTSPVFFDSRHGYLYENAPFTLLTTSDGGRTWSPHAIPAQLSVWTMEFIDPSHGWAVTGDTIDQYELQATSDGGRTWTVVNPTMPPVVDYGNRGSNLLFFSARDGFWATGAVLYRTTDGGKTWKEVPPA